MSVLKTAEPKTTVATAHYVLADQLPVSKMPMPVRPCPQLVGATSEVTGNPALSSPATGQKPVPKLPASPIPVGFHELSDRLVTVLESETPVRLVKAGKLDGLFPSPGKENKRLIQACIGSSPAFLERVASSGAPDPKSQHVRLTAAGLDAIANNLSITELDRVEAKVAGLYKQSFREACLRATEKRLQSIHDQHSQLIAEHRHILNSAKLAITTQIAALEAERAATEQHLRRAAGTRPSTTLEPCRDRDYEFVQHAAGLLVLEWRESTQPEVRAVLEGVFASLGITRVGNVGDTVSFDPRCHDTTVDAELNSNVIVLHSGWQLKTHRGPLLLLKATVSPTINHSDEA